MKFFEPPEATSDSQTPISSSSSTAMVLTSATVDTSTPTINFSRQGYSISESGSMIGSSVRVTRNHAGIASVATIISSSGSAIDGTDFISGTITLNFTASDVYLDVPASSFTSNGLAIADDGTTKGDSFFKLQLAVVSGAVLGSTSVAQMNIIDNDISYTSTSNGTTVIARGSYILPEPFYTVNESDSSLTVTVQRDSTTSAETIGLQLVALTATVGAGSDAYFSGGLTTTTVSFAAGVAEATATVIINADDSTADNNRSFLVKITPTDNSGVQLFARRMAVSKVRILDNEPSNTCTASGVTGGGAGTIADPYRVCTLTHLYKVATSLNSAYKLYADINVDSSLDADSTVAGTQTFVSITGNAGNFLGSFDGNEYVVSNYVSTAALAGMGLFHAAGIGLAGGIIKNLNVIYGSITNATIGSGLIVANNGQSGVRPVMSMTNNFAHGYISTTSNSSGLMVGIVNANAIGNGGVTLSLNKNISSGTVTNTAMYTGGIYGELYATTARNLAINITDNYSNVYVNSTQNGAGGIMGGIATQVSTNTLTISDTESAGFVHTTQYSGSGTVPYIAGHKFNTSITGIKNFAAVEAVEGYACGISGQVTFSQANNMTYSQTNSINYAPVSQTSTSGSARGAAGIGCEFQVNAAITGGAVTFTSNSNYGEVTSNSPGWGTAGIFGELYKIGESWTVTVGGAIPADGNTNYAKISGRTSIGGIVGSTAAFIGSATTYATGTSCVATPCGGVTLTIKNNTNSGKIVGTTAGYYWHGGIVGSLLAPYDGTVGSPSTTILSNNTNSGAVSGAASGVGGIAGFAQIGSTNLDNYFTANIDNNTNSGTVTAVGSSAGGIISTLYAFDGVSSATSIISISSNTNSSAASILATDRAGGIAAVIRSFSEGLGTEQGKFLIQSNLSDSSVTASSFYSGGIIATLISSGSWISTVDINTVTGAVSSGASTQNALGGLIGGLAVCNFTDTKITNNYVSTLGSVGATASGSGTGGGIGYIVMGTSGLLVLPCMNTGDTPGLVVGGNTIAANVAGYSATGGLYGYADVLAGLTITTTDNNIIMSSLSTYNATANNVGGVFGNNALGAGASCVSTKNLVRATITGGTNNGGIGGASGCNVSDSYWSTTNSPAVSRDIGAIVANFQGNANIALDSSAAIFTGWGVETYPWTLLNGNYPTLTLP